MAIGRDTTITWLGHAAVEVRSPGGKVDPVRPMAQQPDEPPHAPTRSRRCDLLLVTHGHGDHMGEAVPLAGAPAPRLAVHPRDEPVARRGGSPAASDQVIGFNKGGTVEAAGLKVSMVGRGPLGRRLERGRGDDALPRRAGRLRGRARERVPDLPRRRHARVRRHGAHPRAVPAGPRAAADRRPLHDGPGRGGARRGAAGRARTSCRSTGARSRSSRARPPQLRDAIAARGGTAEVVRLGAGRHDRLKGE